MDIECKKFAKDVRLLDKEMRPWDTYIMLESTVKNMLTSLRAVGELQNPAIRERHWIQLMASTKVSKINVCHYEQFVHKYLVSMMYWNLAIVQFTPKIFFKSKKILNRLN